MDEKQAVTSVFDLVAKNMTTHHYVFSSCADKLVDYVKITPKQKVLDIATGTGMVAMAAAQPLRGKGRVQAIDISKNMI